MCAASSPTTDISIEISVECLLSELSETEKRSDVDFCCCGMSFGRFVASRSADVRSLFGGNIKCCSKIAQSKCYLRYLRASKPEVQALKSSTVCFFCRWFQFYLLFWAEIFSLNTEKSVGIGPSICFSCLNAEAKSNTWIYHGSWLSCSGVVNRQRFHWHSNVIKFNWIKIKSKKTTLNSQSILPTGTVSRHSYMTPNQIEQINFAFVEPFQPDYITNVNRWNKNPV